jgi:hypothetical protein
MKKASRCSRKGVGQRATTSSPRTRGPQMAMLEEEFVPLELVNTIRERVKAWRERGYPGVTPITRQLLNHWNNPERERRLFFCQREAAETLIWLIEASPAEKQGIAIPKDNGLTRYACKMATGSPARPSSWAWSSPGRCSTNWPTLRTGDSLTPCSSSART